MRFSIRFFDDKEVRAIWDVETDKCFFNIVDICAVLTDSKDPNAYWRWLKRKLRTQKNQTVSDTHAFKNVAHPFLEGNGRSTRIWLDLIFKKRLGKCVDWSKISKTDYLNAMIKSHTDSTKIKTLLRGALTNKINSREMFMKGIDYSYYYEESTEMPILRKAKKRGGK